MKEEILQKYAILLIDYCMELRAGEKLLVQTTTLAEPLVAELYRQCMKKGILMDAILDWEGKHEDFAEAGHLDQAQYVSPTYQKAMEDFDGYLVIRAPFVPKHTMPVRPDLLQARSAAHASLHKLYFERTATRSLKRNLCQYPTEYGAQIASMSLEAYTSFIENACFLNEEDPAKHWVEVRQNQQAIVDHLNKCRHFRYQNAHSDISFSTEGRTWINSDGKTNMPSGEVYTSPVEDSVNGHITFSLPSIYEGKMIERVTLNVKDGWIERWHADTHMDVLDRVFQIPGTRRFGEAAMGTNYRIQQQTNNILFDEKIGGTVHMAIGQSYLQAGGKNESAVHWDMITDMTKDGRIYADGQLIYENGQFLIG